MKTLSTHTTSEGNQLEFCTFDHLPNSVVVIDNSCQMERAYTIGKRKALYFSDYDKEPKERTVITSVEQVIKAWTSEQIHF